jgi:hypothetical protein
MSVPNPCYRIDGRLSSQGDTLLLTLTPPAQVRICAQVIAAYEYEARVTDLPAGSFEMVVLQTYPGTGWARLVHRLKLEIPGQRP